MLVRVGWVRRPRVLIVEAPPSAVQRLLPGRLLPGRLLPGACCWRVADLIQKAACRSVSPRTRVSLRAQLNELHVYVFTRLHRLRLRSAAAMLTHGQRSCAGLLRWNTTLRWRGGGGKFRDWHCLRGCRSDCEPSRSYQVDYVHRRSCRLVLDSRRRF